MNGKEKKKLGRKPTLTADKIIATIKQMKKDGDNVTPSTIRTRITFGGLTNISNVLEKFLKEEGEANESSIVPIENHALSPELEAKINILLSDLTLQINSFSIESDLLANKIAEKRARSAYETMIENNKKLVDEQNLTIKIFDEVEAKNDELNEQIVEIETRLENEQENFSALNADLTKANNELARLKSLLSDTKTSLTTSETKNKSLEKLITKTETRLESSITDKEIAVNESIKIRTQLTEINSRLKSSDAIIDQLKSDITTLQTDKDKVISQLQSTNSDLSFNFEKAQSEHQIAKEKLIATTVQLSSQKETLKEKNERITDLKNQLAELKTIN